MTVLKRLLTKSVALAAIGLSLTACETQHQANLAVNPETTPHTAVEESSAISQANQQRISQLLYQARNALDQDRLTTPIDDNAYLKYLQVLSIDPNQSEANIGISLIVERYLEWALKAAEKHQFRHALGFLNKARSVDENHPNIAATEKRIEDLRDRRQQVYHLAQGELIARSKNLVAKLHTIGRLANAHQARVVIIAPTDAEGRWIYQQLNDADLPRIRANFKTGPAMLLLNYPANRGDN